MHNFIDFPSDKFLQHLNTTTSIGEAVKTFEQNFENLPYGVVFPKKCKNC